MTLAVFLGFSTYVLWLLLNESRRAADVSANIWVVVAWLVLIGSRPLSDLFSFGGISTAQAYDEGSAFDGLIYFGLIAYSLIVLARRGVSAREVIACNRWLFVLVAYWGLSVFWSEAPFLALKRWTKDAGNLLMVMVVLSEAKPVEAMRSVFVRCACLLLPLSVVFIRFIPDLGRTYHSWSGEMMYTGVTTHKNSLGALVMVSVIFLLWGFLRPVAEGQGPRSMLAKVGELSLLCIGGWLLLMAASATALGCIALAVVLMTALGFPSVRANIRALQFLGGVAALALWATGAGNDAMDFLIVDALGRDLTLTTRTDVWPLLLDKADGILFGSGFNSFWSGPRLESIYRDFGIIQAHNGYLDTYLNGGLVGVALLAFVLFSSLRTVNRQLRDGGEYSALAFVLVVITMVYNLTEASFNKMSIVWFAFLMVAIQWRTQQTRAAAAAIRTPSPPPWRARFPG